MPMGKKYLWITSSNQGYFSSLKVQGEDANKDNLNNNILFEESEKKEANEILLEIKKLVKHLYCDKFQHSDRVAWMDEDWLMKGTYE